MDLLNRLILLMDLVSARFGELSAPASSLLSSLPAPLASAVIVSSGDVPIGVGSA